MKVSRRTLLVGGAAAAAAAGAVVALRPMPGDEAALVLDVGLPEDDRWAALGRHLRARYDYLQIPDETLDAFLAAAKEHAGLPRSATQLRKLREKFLMSTDFFLKNADESRPLRFMAWFDPYVSPCWNPLARRVVV